MVRHLANTGLLFETKESEGTVVCPYPETVANTVYTVRVTFKNMLQIHIFQLMCVMLQVYGGLLVM